MVLNNADGLTASAEAAIGRGWAMGRSRGKQSRMAAMDWVGIMGAETMGAEANDLEDVEEEA